MWTSLTASLRSALHSEAQERSMTATRAATMAHDAPICCLPWCCSTETPNDRSHFAISCACLHYILVLQPPFLNSTLQWRWLQRPLIPDRTHGPKRIGGASRSDPHLPEMEGGECRSCFGLRVKEPMHKHWSVESHNRQSIRHSIPHIQR